MAQGDADAQFNLGVIYAQGKGVRQNEKLEKQWFGKAYDNGLQDGCDNYRILNDAGIK
jgi:TPR repeat protein